MQPSTSVASASSHRYDDLDKPCARQPSFSTASYPRRAPPKRGDPLHLAGQGVPAAEWPYRGSWRGVGQTRSHSGGAALLRPRLPPAPLHHPPPPSIWADSWPQQGSGVLQRSRASATCSSEAQKRRSAGLEQGSTPGGGGGGGGVVACR